MLEPSSLLSRVPFLSKSTYTLDICTQWGLGELMRLVDLFSVSLWTSLLTKHGAEVARDWHHFGPRGENGHQTPSPVLSNADAQQREFPSVNEGLLLGKPGHLVHFSDEPGDRLLCYYRPAASFMVMPRRPQKQITFRTLAFDIPVWFVWYEMFSS